MKKASNGPRKVEPIAPDDGVIDDEELAERVASGELVSFVASDAEARPDYVAALRERVAHWRAPPKNQDRNK